MEVVGFQDKSLSLFFKEEKNNSRGGRDEKKKQGGAGVETKRRETGRHRQRLCERV